MGMEKPDLEVSPEVNKDAIDERFSEAEKEQARYHERLSKAEGLTEYETERSRMRYEHNLLKEKQAEYVAADNLEGERLEVTKKQNEASHKEMEDAFTQARKESDLALREGGAKYKVIKHKRVLMPTKEQVAAAAKEKPETPEEEAIRKEKLKELKAERYGFEKKPKKDEKLEEVMKTSPFIGGVRGISNFLKKALPSVLSVRSLSEVPKLVKDFRRTSKEKSGTQDAVVSLLNEVAESKKNESAEVGGIESESRPIRERIKIFNEKLKDIQLPDAEKQGLRDQMAHILQEHRHGTEKLSDQKIEHISKALGLYVNCTDQMMVAARETLNTGISAASWALTGNPFTFGSLRGLNYALFSAGGSAMKAARNYDKAHFNDTEKAGMGKEISHIAQKITVGAASDMYHGVKDEFVQHKEGKKGFWSAFGGSALKVAPLLSPTMTALGITGLDSYLASHVGGFIKDNGEDFIKNVQGIFHGNIQASHHALQSLHPAVGHHIATESASAAAHEATTAQLEHIKELATIHHGEGAIHTFERQITDNPKVFGYTGKIDDVVALHKFVQHRSYEIALKEGFVNPDACDQTFVHLNATHQTQFILHPDSAGHVTVEVVNPKNLYHGYVPDAQTQVHDSLKHMAEAKEHVAEATGVKVDTLHDHAQLIQEHVGKGHEILQGEKQYSRVETPNPKHPWEHAKFTPIEYGHAEAFSKVHHGAIEHGPAEAHVAESVAPKAAEHVAENAQHINNVHDHGGRMEHQTPLTSGPHYPAEAIKNPGLARQFDEWRAAQADTSRGFSLDIFDNHYAHPLPFHENSDVTYLVGKGTETLHIHGANVTFLFDQNHHIVDSFVKNVNVHFSDKLLGLKRGWRDIYDKHHGVVGAFLNKREWNTQMAVIQGYKTFLDKLVAHGGINTPEAQEIGRKLTGLIGSATKKYGQIFSSDAFNVIKK